MRKNPFSLFDFLGYVFPGAFTLFIVCFIIYGNLNNFELYNLDINSINKFNSYIKDQFSIENTIFWTISSYITGHLIAYLSSLTVEQFSIWFYGYPSQFLLEGNLNNKYWPSLGSKILFKRNFRACFWRFIIGTFLLPISFVNFILAEFLGLKYFFLKSLDKNIIRLQDQTVHTLILKRTLRSFLRPRS